MTGATSILRQSNAIALRRLSPDDLSPYQAYRTDPEVGRFQSWERQTDEQATRFLTAMNTLDPVLSAGQWGQIGVALTASNTLIGDMGLFLAQDSVEAEIGITIARQHQRQGHAVTAMRMAIDLVFTNSPATRIICGADSRNNASLAMIRKLGFVWTHTEPGMTGGIDEMFAMNKPADA